MNKVIYSDIMRWRGIEVDYTIEIRSTDPGWNVHQVVVCVDWLTARVVESGAFDGALDVLDLDQVLAQHETEIGEAAFAEARAKRHLWTTEVIDA